MALKPVDGLHVYVAPPFAVSIVLLPLHIGNGVATAIVGLGFTVTVTVVVFVHPLPFVPVIV